jgi:hypothetical protein
MPTLLEATRIRSDRVLRKPLKAFLTICDLGIRTSPGEIIPYCECKECGALCHLLE